VAVAEGSDAQQPRAALLRWSSDCRDEIVLGSKSAGTLQP
jgi:hypothetical protein